MGSLNIDQSLEETILALDDVCYIIRLYLGGSGDSKRYKISFWRTLRGRRSYECLLRMKIANVRKMLENIKLRFLKIIYM